MQLKAGFSYSFLDYLEDRDGINDVHRRACHNLYAFNFEARQVRHQKKAGTLETFIHSRTKNTVYRKVFEYATELSYDLDIQRKAP